MKETTLCYIENDGCYLMMHRTKKKNDPNEGKWIGIGGKLEDGETPECCAVREISEETGLDIEVPVYRGKVYFKSDIYEDEIMHLFTAFSDSRSLLPCDEGELRWIKKKEILSLNLWEGDRVFLEYLLNDKKEFFDITLIYEGDNLKEIKI